MNGMDADGAWASKTSRGGLLADRASRLRAAVHGWRPLPLAPIAQSTIAAMLAYATAAAVLPARAPVLAPLSALMIVQSTLYRTLTGGAQRVTAVAAGVAVAVGVSTVVGLTWWSLGLVVLASLLIGRRLHLGSERTEVPISAMLVLAVGHSAEVAAVGRVYETILGAAVGVLVKSLAPPLYVQSAGDAIGELARRTAGVLDEVGAELETGWTTASAERWLSSARALPGPVGAAREALVRAEESLRLNPRRRTAAHVPDSLHAALVALEHSAIHTRVLCRSMTDRVDGATEELPGPAARALLASLFRAAGAAVREFGALVSVDVTAPVPDDDTLRQALQVSYLRLDAACGALVVDPHLHGTTWQVHGALLAHFDRLLHEIDPATDRAAVAVGRPVRPMRPRRAAPGGPARRRPTRVMAAGVRRTARVSRRMARTPLRRLQRSPGGRAPRGQGGGSRVEPGSRRRDRLR